MATQFSITVDLGPRALLSVISLTISDLQVIGNCAVGIAEVQASDDARQALADLVASDGTQALLVRARQLELPENEYERLTSDLRYLEEAFLEYENWFGPRSLRRGRLRRAALAEALLGPPGALGVGVPGSSRAMERLVAAEMLPRLPASGPRVQTFSYQNPVITEILVDATALGASMAVLLGIIRDWSARRRRENARAAAEERIQNARAQDAEDQVAARIQLRRAYVQRVVRGEAVPSIEEVDRLLNDGVAEAATRLADRDLTFTQATLPDK